MEKEHAYEETDGINKSLFSTDSVQKVDSSETNMVYTNESNDGIWSWDFVHEGDLFVNIMPWKL